MGKVIIDRPKTIAYTQKVTRAHVSKTCAEILMGARRLAPRGDHMSGSGKRKLGRSLQASLGSNIDMGLRYVTGRVGSSANWAATVHQGSERHRIRPLGNRKLMFEWPKGVLIINARRKRRGRGRIPGPRVFFFEEVMHPGNKRPVRYLTTPMHQYGRANGFRTTSLAVTRSRLP